MRSRQISLGLINGIIVTDSCALYEHVLIIHGGYIIAIKNQKSFTDNEVDEVYDCQGKYIFPGLIDIHSDAIENFIVPRKGIVFDTALALHEIDRYLIARGITTIYHSISIANSTICNNKRTLTVEEMLKLGEYLSVNTEKLLIRHQFHARLEINTSEAFNPVLKQIEKGTIKELSFMDHTPGQGQYRDVETFRKEIVKQYGNIPIEKQNEIISQCISKTKLNQQQIQLLIDAAKKHQIPIAYHDVETVGQVEWMRLQGIKICEFPLSMHIAKKAKESGLWCLVGSPNVLKNGSHNNNASATNLINNNYADILCSDYYPPSLLRSIFTLASNENIPLHKAVKLASKNPADAIGLGRELGSLSIGKIADIIVIDFINCMPTVVDAFIGGQHCLSYRYS